MTERHTDGALYHGVVAHKRARPKRHSLRYNVFSMLVDLDQLKGLERRLKFSRRPLQPLLHVAARFRPA